MSREKIVNVKITRARIVPVKADSSHNEISKSIITRRLYHFVLDIISKLLYLCSVADQDSSWFEVSHWDINAGRPETWWMKQWSTGIRNLRQTIHWRLISYRKNINQWLKPPQKPPTIIPRCPQLNDLQIKLQRHVLDPNNKDSSNITLRTVAMEVRLLYRLDMVWQIWTPPVLWLMKT